jgi:hypothetical protein
VSGSDTASFLVAVTVAWSIGAGVYLAFVIRSHTTEGPAGVLAVAATYAVPVAGGHAGPVSAGLEGLALLALAYAVQHDVRVRRRLPQQTLAWTPATVGLVVAVSAVLDLVVAVVAGGGDPRPGSVSTLAVLAGCLAVTALVLVVLALAEGLLLPRDQRPL